MSLSFSTYVDILFCLVAIFLFRPLPICNIDLNGKVTSREPQHAPAPLTLNGKYGVNSPLDSASVPSITVSAASCSLDNESSSSGNDQGEQHGILKGKSRESNEKSGTIVSFASSALLVEPQEPPSATSSDTLPSPKAKVPVRRESGHIKISSVPAQDGGEHTKHTLKGRPLTPFVKFDATTMEEPLTAQVISEFDIMNGLPSPFAKTSVEGSTDGLDVSVADIESVAFDDAGVPAKIARTSMLA